MAATDSTLTADKALPGLGERFSGAVLRPGDANYDPARALWNAAADRRPALIARARTDADVVAAGNALVRANEGGAKP
jgi:hypothetical protein